MSTNRGKKKTIKNTNIWRQNNTHLNNQQITGEIKKEIKICTEMNENENTTTKHISVQFSSDTQSCPKLCDTMDNSMPRLLIHYQLQELKQTHVHRVGDAIQSSHPLSYLFPSVSTSIRDFSNEPALCIRWPNYWSFSFNISPSNEHSGLISFRMD